MTRPQLKSSIARFGLGLFAAIIFTGTNAFSASGVSPKFDGRYEGAMTPASDSNPRQCPAVRVSEFVVKGGYVRAPAKIADVQTGIFDGFVTEEGFVTGHFRMPGETARSDFEGRMVNDAGTTLLSGGISHAPSGCAYLLEIRKVG